MLSHRRYLDINGCNHEAQPPDHNPRRPRVRRAARLRSQSVHPSAAALEISAQSQVSPPRHIVAITQTQAQAPTSQPATIRGKLPPCRHARCGTTPRPTHGGTMQRQSACVASAVGSQRLALSDCAASLAPMQLDLMLMMGGSLRRPARNQ